MHWPVLGIIRCMLTKHPGQIATTDFRFSKMVIRKNRRPPPFGAFDYHFRGHPWLYEVMEIQSKPLAVRSMSQFIAKGIDWNPDLVIGHNPGALAPATKIAQRLGILAMFDAEAGSIIIALRVKQGTR